MRNIVIVEPHSTGMNFIQDVIRRGFWTCCIANEEYGRQ